MLQNTSAFEPIYDVRMENLYDLGGQDFYIANNVSYEEALAIVETFEGHPKYDLIYIQPADGIFPTKEVK